LRKGLISLIVLAAVGAAVGWFLSAPQRLDADTVAALGEGDATRGQRIFWAGGCASCHAASKSEGEARRQLGGARRWSRLSAVSYRRTFPPTLRMASGPGRRKISPMR
jgi:mono/diheme cytochrome c family protein